MAKKSKEAAKESKYMGTHNYLTPEIRRMLRRDPLHYYLPNGETPPWRDPARQGKRLNKLETKLAKRMFLNNLASCGIVSTAARATGITTGMVSTWRKKSEKFEARFQKAMMNFVDTLETIAIDRAKVKSDSLLLALLRAKRPEVYGPKLNLKHSGDLDEPVRLIFSDAEVGEADEQQVPPQD